MITDAPMDDLQWEAEAYDAARFRERDASCLACGRHMVTTAALGSCGRLVAFTQIVATEMRASALSFRAGVKARAGGMPGPSVL